VTRLDAVFIEHGANKIKEACLVADVSQCKNAMFMSVIDTNIALGAN
jgi:hypothetical protein